MMLPAGPVRLRESLPEIREITADARTLRALSHPPVRLALIERADHISGRR